MPAAAVVEGLDVIKDNEPCGGFGRRDGVVEAFGLEGRDEAPGQRIVVGVALAVHAGRDVLGAETFLQRGGGILDAAVTVMDKAGERSLPKHGLLKGRDGQGGEQVFAAVVRGAAPGTGIEGEGEVEPVFLGLDVGDVALPDL